MLTDGSPLHLVSSVGGISFSSAFAYHGDDTLLSPASTAFTHVQTPPSSAYNPSKSEAADSDYVAASEPIFPNTAIRKSKRIMTRTKCSKAAKPLPTKSKSKHARHPRPASTARSTSDSEGTSSYGSFPFACPHCKRRFARKYDMSVRLQGDCGLLGDLVLTFSLRAASRPATHRGVSLSVPCMFGALCESLSDLVHFDSLCEGE